MYFVPCPSWTINRFDIVYSKSQITTPLKIRMYLGTPVMGSLKLEEQTIKRLDQLQLQPDNDRIVAQVQYNLCLCDPSNIRMSYSHILSHMQCAIPGKYGPKCSNIRPKKLATISSLNRVK